MDSRHAYDKPPQKKGDVGAVVQSAFLLDFLSGFEELARFVAYQIRQ